MAAMNILFASSISAWGGGEHWMLSAALGLKSRSHNVDLAVREGSLLGERAGQAGLAVHPIRFHGDFDPATTLYFYRLCRRLRPDVFCLNMDRVLRVAGPGAKAAGVRAIVPRRGSEMPVGGKVSHKLSYRNLATGVIANSQATRRTMLDSAPWLPPEKVRVIYNGIKVADFDRPEAGRKLRAELGVEQTTPVIGMVGELTDRKNHIHLIRQLPALRETVPGLEVWIVGEGPEGSRLRYEAGQLGVEESVRLLGFRRDVPDIMNAIDLLVHPALMEGFGYVLVEAMAAGKPVVAADTSNLSEIVLDGETGYLCPAKDGQALKQAVTRILADPEHAGALGKAGRARVQGTFSFERMIQELETYFGELVS
jgi:glycosyltransferase involved in cell wall biosynthesis